MARKLGFFGLTVAAVLSYLIYFIGFLAIPENLQNYSNCEYLTTDLSLFGPEDAVIYNKDILIGIFSQIHTIYSKFQDANEVKQGGLFAVYGISTGKLVEKKIKINNYPSITFHPHGIYISRPDHLHLINHSFSSGGERVDTFKIRQTEEGKIVLDFLHFTEMGDSFNGITNDLAFISADRFIISSWLPYAFPKNGQKDMSIVTVLRTVYGILTKSKFTYAWDCKYVKGGIAQCTVLRDGQMINGVEFDGKDTLLIADTLARHIHIYHLSTDNKLTLVQTVTTAQMPDNISYDYTRSQFLVAGLSTTYQFLALHFIHDKVLSNPSNKSNFDQPSVVETIQLNPTTKRYKSSILFSSTSAIVGVSGALIDESGKYLFLTSFPDKSIAVCTQTN